MNKVVLIGRLTKDPELKFTPGAGTAVTNITVAVDKYNSRTGQREADFIPVVIWGKKAESVATYLNKGSQLAVEGRIQTRNYEAKDGTRRYVTEVVATDVQFLSGRSGNNNGSNNSNNSQQYSNNSAPKYNQAPPSDVFSAGGFGDDIVPVDESDMPF